MASNSIADSAIEGIALPIIQAPMAGVQNWELAIAVARAGGLGSIPCGMLNVEQILHEVTQFRANSAAPYNLNFFCHEMPAVDATVLRRWREQLAPFYREFGLETKAGGGPLRRPFDSDIAEALAPFAPPVVSFHFGLPDEPLLQQVKSWGAVVLASATTLEEGRWLQAHGADVVIAQGLEAGGHRGMFLTDDLESQQPLEQLLPQLVQALTVPVVAAGGIDSAAAVARLFRQGAAGVQVGTSYLLCEESQTSQLQREALLQSEAHTAITNLFSGRPARGIRNRLMRELGDISSIAPPFPHAATALAPLRAAAEARGFTDFSPLWCGTARTGCSAVSATQLTEELARDIRS